MQTVPLKITKAIWLSPVNLYRKLSAQSAQRIQYQCFQFVFSGIDMDGSKERHALLQPRSDVLGMCHTSRKQNGVHLAIKHNSSTAYLLGNAVNHGIKHQSGMGVSLSDAPLYGGNVGSTQMGGKSRLAGNTFLQFFGSVTPRVTKVYQLPGGQGTCTFGRKGPKPSRALGTSTARPWRWTPTETPPPK